MITLILLPNFKGTKKQFLKALIVCVFVDFVIIGSLWL